MEISPQHHKIVMGPCNDTLRAITHRTGAQILFPDANDPNIPSIKKSSVTITGHIHNVYAARQMLIVIYLSFTLLLIIYKLNILYLGFITIASYV